MTSKVTKTDAEWREQLTKEQYHITRKSGTERAFTGEYVDNHDDGEYSCVCCGAALFHSDTKYDSGSGWPSFQSPAVAENIEEKEDRSLFATRTEVRCAQCEAHLGHVFPDGPGENGLRYCINSASLDFEKDDS